MRRRLALVVAVALVAVALGACGDDTDSSATRSEVLANLGSRVIGPSYERLNRATADLSDAVDDLCATPDATRLANAQDAWEQAWEAWNRTRAFRFGPATDTRATSDIAFMANTTKIDALLAGADSSLGPPFSAATLAETGSDVRGLGAVEHVLFDADATTAAACSYAAAAAELVATAAHSVSVAWNEGVDGEAAFVRQLASPGTGAYSNAQGAIDDLVNGVAMALTETTRELANADAAPPDERDIAGRHGGSRVRDVLWSVSALYFGSTDGTDGAGVDDLVAAVSPTSDERVRDFIERATRSTDQLPAALSEAEKSQLRRAYRLVRNSGTIVRAEVASELGVTLSLGDSDGDS